MQNGYLLGVDIGTSSIKVVIIDNNAQIHGVSQASYKLISHNKNYIQIDTEDCWKTYIKCLKNIFSEKLINPKEITGIGISGLCPGLTAFDDNGNVLVEPIIYSDRRSLEEANFIGKTVDNDNIFSITANRVMAGAISSTSMLWIKRNMPEQYRNTKYFGHINTLFAYLMTKSFAIDYSNASYTGLFETVKGNDGNWSEELCSKIGIDIKKLPPILSSYNVVGYLNNHDIISLGIPKDTPVVIGGGDTACATFAAGITKDGDVCESVGTTNVLTVCVDKPLFDNRFLNRCHVVDGTWIYQGALSHVGSSLQWFRDNFCQDIIEKTKHELCDKTAYQLMDEEAFNSSQGANGVVFLPYMLGERSPIWDPYARGVFFGISLFNKRNDLIRAIMEGCGYGLRQLIEIAQEIRHSDISGFISIGGGAKSQIWAKIKSDITGKDITILDINDMAPVGAALLAGVGNNTFENVYQASDKVNKSVYKYITSNNSLAYENNYKVYTNLYPKIKDLFAILNND